MAEIRATPQQRAAAEDRGGALLVAAAAGSGKTKVLVDRLMGYLTDPTDPADLDEFLIITYTRAAASELRGKIAARIAEALAGTPNDRHLQRQLTRVYLAQISTVHSFCQAVLRQYAAEANLPADFRVADEQQAAALRAQTLRDVLSELYAKLDDEPDFAAMIDTLGYGRDDRRLLELAERSYEVMRCKVDPEAWMAGLPARVCAAGGDSGGADALGRVLSQGAQGRARKRGRHACAGRSALPRGRGSGAKMPAAAAKKPRRRPSTHGRDDMGRLCGGRAPLLRRDADAEGRGKRGAGQDTARRGKAAAQDRAELFFTRRRNGS